MARIERPLLIVLDSFLAVTAIAGGIGLLTGTIALPLAWLQGAPFTTYTIPGLTLLLIVGGSASLATCLLLLRHARGAIAAGISGAMIIGFELVEVLIVGSEAGLMRSLQAFYVALGLLIVALAAWWKIRPAEARRDAAHLA